MVLCSAIIWVIRLAFDNSEALSDLVNQIISFSCHFDKAQTKSVKKFEILHNLSQQGGGSMFGIGQIRGFWQ